MQRLNDYISVGTNVIDFDGNMDMRKFENDGDLHVDGNIVAYSNYYIRSKTKRKYYNCRKCTRKIRKTYRLHI